MEDWYVSFCPIIVSHLDKEKHTNTYPTKAGLIAAFSAFVGIEEQGNLEILQPSSLEINL